MQVVDVVVANDGQGVILAVYSPKDAVCWYAVDLEVDSGRHDRAGGTPALPGGPSTTASARADWCGDDGRCVLRQEDAG